MGSEVVAGEGEGGEVSNLRAAVVNWCFDYYRITIGRIIVDP